MSFHRLYALKGFFNDPDNAVTVKNQDKTIIVNGTYTPDPEYTGFGMVTVEVPDSEKYHVAEQVSF